MIHTVTLNPAVDKIVNLPALVRGTTNRLTHTRLSMGGKGTLVAMNLAHMGAKCCAFGHFGGDNGRIIVRMLEEAGITPLYPADTVLNSRCNTIITEEDGTTTTLSEKGAIPPESEQQALIELLKTHLKKGDAVVLSGDASNYPEQDVYDRMIGQLASLDVRVYLDASGAYLSHGAKAHPFLIKPNLEELQTLCGCTIAGEQQVAAAIGEISRRYQIPVVAVSLGSDGSMVKIPDGRVLRIEPQVVQPHNTAGCGDCFLASLVLCIESGMPWEQVLRTAAANSAAKAESTNTYGFDKQRAAALMDAVQIRCIQE